jgi:membrane-associated phospholipid phosphatase
MILCTLSGQGRGFPCPPRVALPDKDTENEDRLMRKRDMKKGSIAEAAAWIGENRHCYLMLYWIFYLAAFFLLEMREGEYYLIECSLDKKIPFAEEFVIPYVSWFGLLAGALFWSMFCCKKDFLRLAFVMFVGNTICLGIYFIAPNGIHLRPETVPDNLWGWMVGLLYQADTSTNVCPSIHVSSSVAVALVGWRSELLKNRKTFRILLYIWVVLICLSTMFIKQHSIVDVIWGTVLSVCLFGILWRVEKFWAPVKNLGVDFLLK